jgi:L-rhamnose mutarotase
MIKQINMIKSISVISLFYIAMVGISCNNQTGNKGQMEDSSAPEVEKVSKRVGMVVKIKEEHIEEYKRIHAPDNPGVRDLLSKYNMRNFSIFLQKLDDGNYYEFGYYEYVGNDFEGDMERLAAEPRNIEWLKVCDPMQVPLEGYESWAEMELVYYNP